MVKAVTNSSYPVYVARENDTKGRAVLFIFGSFQQNTVLIHVSVLSTLLCHNDV